MTAVLDIASTQTSIVVRFSADPEVLPPILDNVLPFLGLAGTQCEVNEYLIPLKTGLHFTLAPSIEATMQSWTPWDDEIDGDHRYHLMVTDVSLYARMQDFSSRHNHALQLSVSNDPAMNRVAHLELHLLSQVEVVELLNRLYREMRSQRAELETIKREFKDLRNRFGTLLENLAAYDDSLAPVLGLVHPQPDHPPTDDGPA